MSEGFWVCFFAALLLLFLIGCWQAIRKVTSK